MKNAIRAGLLAAITLITIIGMTTSCKSPFGVAGEAGIDTVGVVISADTLTMVTTDNSLIPTLSYPSNKLVDLPVKPTLFWNKVAGAVKYRILISSSPRFSSKAIDPSKILDDSTSNNSDTSKVISLPLSNYSTYYWVINAKGSNGKEAWSQKFYFKTMIDSVILLRQKAYVAQKFGMFIHFNMSTYARKAYSDPMGEWELGNEDPNLFHPDSLNLGQWADVAKSAHCKYAVMTTKHHGGFCLWPYQGPWPKTPHSILQSQWYTDHGQRDICREFVDSMRSRGIAPGFYYSVRDETNKAPIFFVKAQLRELLTKYGEIKVIWFDGWGWNVGYSQVPYDTVANLVHHINDSLGFNTIISENNHRFSYYNSEIAQYEIPIDGPPLLGNTYSAEGNEPVRTDGCWFWHPQNECAILTLQTAIENIQKSNSRNATYLLDLTPDTTGLIPQCQVQLMSQIGPELVSKGMIEP
jgi:hypothetical protein